MNNELYGNTAPASQNQEQQLHIPKEKLVIPIIFLPGVMGSNLKSKSERAKDNSKPIWRLDSGGSAFAWSLPGYGSASTRRKELDPLKVSVDNRGKLIDAEQEKLDNLYQGYVKALACCHEEEEMLKLGKEYQIQRQAILDDDKESKLFGTRRERGWGSVSFISYGEFLEWLQKTLFSTDGGLSQALTDLEGVKPFQLDDGSTEQLDLIAEQIKLCKGFHFPVHVMGYNWLGSNADSAKELKNLIENQLPRYYKKRGLECNKVILVTHSMGGLVARHYMQTPGGKDRVYGVVHSVMPAIGAVATYTRMKRGTEANSSWLEIPKNAIMEEVLGNDALEMTAVCAQSPGPLQLLPSSQYQNGWLKINHPDGTKTILPKSNDPYTDIYLEKDNWWGLCEPHLINPLNVKHHIKTLEDDWQKYEKIIKKVKEFHLDLKNKYHPHTYSFFGVDDNESNIKTEYLTYNEAHWQGEYIKGYKDATPEPIKGYLEKQGRLDLSEIKEIRTIVAKNNDWRDALVKVRNGVRFTQYGNIKEHYTLQDAKHNGDGTVPRSSGEIDLSYLKARMPIAVGHEPAYQSEKGQNFTLRSIVNILLKTKLSE